MSLGPGTRLGPYEIQSAIGAGGMGEVYRATDTNLGRTVAIKVLPEAFAQDAERVARFEREAKTLASLNHPNIAIIHGLEKSQGTYALVMELVEGDDLSQRIARGPIPLDEALPIAKQIAEALEAAHEQGIIHRDLKPANINVRSDGTVKVLDFGLAKLTEPPVIASGNANALSMSPTITSPAMMTGIGVLLGTAAYMAPEQARGKAIDKRADIWAFGCVLYEMLTKKRPFDAEEISDTFACLEKDRRKRLPDIAVARLEIDDARLPTTADAVHSQAAPARRTSQRPIWSAAAVCAGAIAGLASYVYFSVNAPPPALTAVRASVVIPPNVHWAIGPTRRLALSPDGRRLAFAGRGPDGVSQIWVRSLDGTAEAQPMRGTDGAELPYWSPDGRFVAFWERGQLKKIDVASGSATTITQGSAGAIAWNDNDVILFTPTGMSPIHRVSASGGPVTPVTTLDTTRGELSHFMPVFLPDGRHFLYSALVRGERQPSSDISAQPFTESVYVGSLDAGEPSRLLWQDGSTGTPRYALGHLILTRGTTLFAQPFDIRRLQVTGEPVPLAEQVASRDQRGSALAVSANGVIAYQTGSDEGMSQLTWFDRSGKDIGKVGEPGDYMSFELSPDGQRAAVSVLEAGAKNRDLWLFDLIRGLRTQLTFGAGDEFNPVWSPDGARIVFASLQSGAISLYQKVSNGAGTEDLVLSDKGSPFPHSWAPDGRHISYATGAGGDIWILPIGDTGKASGKPEQFLKGRKGRFSPDGRWIVYVSEERGRAEIFVSPFPGPGGQWRVSSAGGDWPRWRRDGKEIFFRSPDNTLMAAEVNGTGAAFSVGVVRSLFEIHPRVRGNANVDPGLPGYDVSPDGQRFLVNEGVEGDQAPITLLVNWPALLNKQ